MLVLSILLSSSERIKDPEKDFGFFSALFYDATKFFWKRISLPVIFKNAIQLMNLIPVIHILILVKTHVTNFSHDLLAQLLSD